MRGHIHLDATRQLPLRVDDGDGRVDLIGRPGDHRLLRRGIHRHRDIGVLPDQLLGVLGTQLQQRHRALTRQPRHQLRPGGNDFQTISRAQRPGHHRRGHLTHRMPDHRIGLNTVRAPQRGQRQLHTHQHRLNTLDTNDRLTRQQHITQRKTNLRNKIRLQLGHRRSKRRLIGQQLPTHPRPLRTLTRIQKHRARATRHLCAATTPGVGWPAASARSPATSLAAVARGHRGDFVVATAVEVHGVRDVGQRHVGTLARHPIGQCRRP